MPERRETILVIEDHADVREGLRLALAAEGYEVAAAPNGREALRQLYNGLRPCLIIMDLMMPVMNGFEFREAQLAEPAFADIPVIAYSGVTDPRKTAQQLRAAAYLHKPAHAEQLAALVKQLRPKLHPGGSSGGH